MAEGTSANFSSCCRLCLSDKYSTLKSIFGEEAESRALSQKILHFLGVEVSSNDKLSTMICTNCLHQLNNWDSFKKECSENQIKLQEWLSLWSSCGSDLGNVNIQIKHEPVDQEDSQRQENVDVNQAEHSVIIKSEPIVEIDEFYENPPPLTPNPPDVSIEGNEGDCNSVTSLDEFHLNDDGTKRSEGKQCSFCNKEFSTVGNRLKHERIIHSNKRKSAHCNSGSVTSNQDDSSQLSMESQASSSINTEASVIPATSENEHSSSELAEVEIEKIQFAAGLCLKQKSATTSDKFIDEPLSKIELAYLDRCKAMVSMLHSFKCSCHNVSFPTIKRLFAHLRMCYTWFPIFTCYNCVITFSNRSGSMKHTGKCPKQYLQNIIRMAEMEKRMESKIRIYQYCKCMKCANLYSFHEDYCEHIDKEHVSEPPYRCMCSKEFESAEEFKLHLYISCYLNYYCDVCYTTFDNLNEFKAHCESTHDIVEEYTFVTSEASFKMVNHEEILAANKKRAFEEITSPELDQGEEDGNDRKKLIIMTPKTVNQDPVNCEICDRRFSNYYTLKKHMKGHRRNNFSNGWKNKPSNCDKCGKVFSTFYNMLRHKRVHDDSEKNLQCALCTERYRLISELKDHLILVHGQANVCQECGRQFESLEELDQHRSVHLNIKVYRDSKTDSYRTSTQQRLICEICDRTFENETQLNEHALKHDTMPVLNVETESDEIKDDKMFRKFSCVECDRHYVSYKGLWLHNKRHHPERKKPSQQPYQCRYCDRILQTNAAYQMHKQMHERMMMRQTNSGSSTARAGDEEEESYHTCKHCFKVFSSKYNLKTHLKTHGVNISPSRTYSKMGKYVKTFWCDICHQACQGFSELQKHKQEHINEKMQDGAPELEIQESVRDTKPHLFPCDICAMVFTSKFAVRKHKEKHETENRGEESHKFVYCKYCKIPFLDIDALNNHMDLEHEETIKAPKPRKELAKKFACDLCKKVFDTAGALCSHQGWHKRGKADKILKSQQKLFRKMVHDIPKPSSSDVRKHECISCSLMFLTDTALQIHILEAHRNINATVVPPRCGTCNVDFTTQEAYENHTRLHRMVDSSKAFPCKYCNKGFSRSDSLNAHIRQLHKEHLEASFKCYQCDRIFEKQNALTIHLKVHERQKVTGLSAKQTKTHLYSCSICHLGFDIPKELRNHIITTHPF